MRARAVLLLAIAACHVTARHEITRPVRSERTRLGGANGLAPTLVLTTAGRLRFVEPLACPTEEVVIEERAIEIVRGPNLATFVVGVIATAVGGILVVRGANDDDGAANPFTYGGIAALAVGMPLAVGPWLGNGTQLREGPRGPPVRRPGPTEPCGERGFAADHATLATRGIEVFGRVDRDGYFSVSPYAVVDAFAPSAAAWQIASRVEARGRTRTIDIAIDGRALGAGASEFLVRADFDPTIESLRLVPGIAPGTLRVSLTTTADGPAARIVLAVDNAGPGPAYALRGHVTAPGTPALDGRILYFGHVAKGATRSRELLVPLSPAAAAALRNATIDLAVELHDAHGTAPTTPVRFRGTILVDAPR